MPPLHSAFIRRRCGRIRIRQAQCSGGRSSRFYGAPQPELLLSLLVRRGTLSDGSYPNRYAWSISHRALSFLCGDMCCFSCRLGRSKDSTERRPRSNNSSWSKAETSFVPDGAMWYLLRRSRRGAHMLPRTYIGSNYNGIQASHSVISSHTHSHRFHAGGSPGIWSPDRHGKRYRR